ncbi:hypothetical protein [Microbacterium panaciterrae]|uniref:Uncharacterized protein n=1 Tax=Microbacterium panaciterrae TaxID=985759 RepID=A0ABP8P791_9MICO
MTIATSTTTTEEPDLSTMHPGVPAEHLEAHHLAVTVGIGVLNEIARIRAETSELRLQIEQTYLDYDARLNGPTHKQLSELHRRLARLSDNLLILSVPMVDGTAPAWWDWDES